MSSFQNLFNEYNISTDSLQTNNLIVTGTIDLNGATIVGFPVDNTTIEINEGVLAVKDLGIKSPQLANSSVTTNKIGNKSVTNEKLEDNSVTNEKLEDKSVTTDKITDLNVTDDKIASVSSSKVIGTIVNDVNNEMIITEDLSVNGDAIVVGTLDVKDITAQNITAVETIDAQNITAQNITAVDTIDAKNITVENITIENVTLPTSVTVDNLTVNHGMDFRGHLINFPIYPPPNATLEIDSFGALIVRDGGITYNQIADGSILTSKLNNSVVTNVKLADNSVSESKIINLVVTQDKLSVNAVTEIKISDLAVTTPKINNNAITTSKINDNAITTTKIIDNAIITSKILDSNVTSSKIANDAITTTKLLNGCVTSDKLDSNIDVSGQITVNNLILTSTTDSTSTTTGSLVTAGGVGIAKSVNIGGRTMVRAVGGGESAPNLYTQTASNNVSIGFGTGTSSNKVMLTGNGASNNPYKLIEWDAWNGGGGVTDFNNTNLYSQSNVAINYNNTRVNIPITTDSTSSGSGALITAGGVGIAKKLYVAGEINSNSSITENISIGTTSPVNSLVSLSAPENYPGIIITRGSNKRWDIQNANSSSSDDLFINSKNADNSSSTTKLRLGWGNTDTTHLGSFIPDSDNSYTLGNSLNRWSNLYSSTGNFYNISAIFGTFSTYANVISSSPAYTAIMGIENTSNTSASAAQLLLRVAGSSAGNPYITHQVTSGASFSTGVDNKDSDKYKISNHTSLGTNDALTIDTDQVVSFNKNIGSVGGRSFYGCRAFTRFNGTVASNRTGTYTKAPGNTSVTVTMTAHGFKVENQVYIQYTSSSGTLPTSEISLITSVSANTFVASGTTALGVSGNLTLPGRLPYVANNINFISYVDVGRYIINFASAFLNNEFTTSVTSKYNTASNRYDVFAGVMEYTSGAVQVYTGFGSFSYFNSVDVNVVIHQS